LNLSGYPALRTRKIEHMFPDQLTLTDGTANHVYDLRGRLIPGPNKLRAERQKSEFDDTPEQLVIAHEQIGNLQKSVIRISSTEKESTTGKLATGFAQLTLQGTKGVNTAAVLKGLIKQLTTLIGTAGYDDKFINQEV